MRQTRQIYLSLTTLVIVFILLIQGAQIVNANGEIPEFEMITKVLKVGGSDKLEIKNMIEGSTQVWSTDNENVVIVDEYGVVKANGVGIANVICEIFTGNDTYTLTMQIVVERELPVLSVYSLNLKMGDKDFLVSVDNLIEGDVYMWYSLNGSVASVSRNGEIRARKTGKTTIVFYTYNNTLGTEYKLKVDVNIIGPTLKKKNLSVIEGRKSSIGIKNKVNGARYTYKSSNNKIAKVSSKGVITGVKKGTAKIKVKITFPAHLGLKSMTLWSKVKVNGIESLAKKIVYGKSGQGRDLYAKQIGNGKKTLILTFALHGYEDHWAQDGKALVYIANETIKRLCKYDSVVKKKGWTVYVIPAANPDGVNLSPDKGGSMNGPGRCTVKSMIDLNRCFDYGFYPIYNSRNYNGWKPTIPVEAKSLKKFVEEKGSKNDKRTKVLVDCHGWLNVTYGSKRVSKYFDSKFGIGNGAYNSLFSPGYFYSWASSARGYDAAMVELPSNIWSMRDVYAKNLAGKYSDAVMNLIKDY